VRVVSGAAAAAVGRAEELGLGCRDLIVGRGAHRATARTGAGSLTGSERRIAELAAMGGTDAEISDLPHLARRTVETHLTNSDRKSGIRRRNEPRAALGAGRADAPYGVGIASYGVAARVTTASP
jgi:DNA-binding CsgD family transcriptional regulator